MEAKGSFKIALVLCLAWQASVICQNFNCTAPGRFANPADPTCQNYTLCVFQTTNNTYLAYNYVCPTTSVFNPNSAQCTASTNYVCPATTTTTTPAPPAAVCTADGYVADPNSSNCTSYIECVNINGIFTQTLYTCPPTTFFNPNTTNCETNYICTTTAPFSCSAAGRFANPVDTTCQTYYLCVLATNGTFVNYEYTCPTTSVFNPNSSVCTTSYTCTS